MHEHGQQHKDAHLNKDDVARPTVLATMHGQLVQMSVTTDAVGEEQLTDQIRSLRSRGRLER